MKLRTKINNLSGVYPISIYLKPQQCTSNCIYCPSDDSLPNSYLENSDTLLAKNFNFCPKEQLNHHLNSIRNNNNNILQFEIIILGGTFSDYSRIYREEFILNMFNTLNNKKSNNLDEAKILNETSLNRCSVLTIETRPDKINQNELDFLLDLGITKIELGIQSLNNSTLKRNNRNYNFDEILKSTNNIKIYGFKLGFHIMVGLPFSNIKHEVELFNKYLWNMLRPDYLKIYPFIYLGKKYQPKLDNFIYDKNITKQYEESIIELKKNVPSYVRISRINRQFEWIKDLPIVDRKIIAKKSNCKCIKCKEPYYKHVKLSSILYELIVQDNDIYIIAKNNKFILGILRAYIINNEFIVREVKIFGISTNIGKNSNVQGRGIGKRLLNMAILEANKSNTIIKILSSTGAIQYYYNLGFIKNKNYLILEPLADSTISNS